MRVDHPIISAVSHITEAPKTYIDYIDPAYRETAPRIVSTDDKGDIYVIDGMRRSIPRRSFGLVTEVTWRATRIRTKTGNLVIVPNNVMAREAITNYSEPTLPTRLDGTVICPMPDAVSRSRCSARTCTSYCSLPSL